VRALAAPLAFAAVVLAACGPSPGPTQIGPPDAPGPSVPELAAGEVTDDGITLAVTAEPAVVSAGEAIEVEAVLTHDRREPLTLVGSGSGIVFFSVTRLEDGLTSGSPGWRLDCRQHILPAGEPTVVPFSKSGGIDSEDPNAEFRERFFADPELTLPPGTWRIDITTGGTTQIQECGGPALGLELSLVVTVTE